MKFNHEQFLETCGGDKLKKGQRDGLDYLLTCFENDGHMNDIRWIAYGFATVERECAGTYCPIQEYGKGKGLPYSTIYDGHVYYGRGFVQLTWRNNYKTMGDILGYDLLNRPELALQPEISYKIMSYGMRNGSFTGVGLKKYINGDKCDYLNARRVINGLDHATEIAKVAEWFETVLLECQI